MNEQLRSLEELENRYTDAPDFPSYVVSSCHKARKKPLCELTHEEIRLMIGQKMGLKYLLHMALDILENDPLVEVTFYEGDLLNELLRLDISDWDEMPQQLERFRCLLNKYMKSIKGCDDISSELLEKYI